MACCDAPQCHAACALFCRSEPAVPGLCPVVYHPDSFTVDTGHLFCIITGPPAGVDCHFADPDPEERREMIDQAEFLCIPDTGPAFPVNADRKNPAGFVPDSKEFRIRVPARYSGTAQERFGKAVLRNHRFICTLHDQPENG
jgi:hypothetical protein